MKELPAPPPGSLSLKPLLDACHGNGAPVNQDHVLVSQVTERTLAALGLLRRDHRTAFHWARFSMLTRRAYPTASLKRLQVCNDWHQWLWTFDDMVDMIGGQYASDASLLQRVMDQTLAALRYGVACDEPIVRYALIIRDRFLAEISLDWLLDFADAVEAYLVDGTMKAACHNIRRTVATVDDYVHQRLRDSAMETCIRLTEFACELTLPDAVWSCPTVTRLRHLCADFVGLHNDILSFEKEWLIHRNPNNLIYVLAVDQGRTVAQAVDHAIRLVIGLYREFVAVEQAVEQALGQARDVPAAHARDVATFARGLRHWMEGSADWHVESGRYKSTTSPFREFLLSSRPRQARYSDRPAMSS